MHFTQISRNHPNRDWHNFSVYSNIDRFLYQHRDSIKGSVYDLGCGEMPYRPWVLSLPNVTEYTGVDWGKSPHELLANIVADLNQELPINSASADSVISFSVMEHLSEPITFLKEVHRILKPGGTLVLQVPFQWKIHEAPFDYFRYTRFGLEHILTKADFECVVVEETSGAMLTIALKVNYWLRRFTNSRIALFRILGPLCNVVFYLSQVVGMFIDRLVASKEESNGYFVIARKI